MRDVKVLISYYQATQLDLERIGSVDHRVKVAFAFPQDRATRDFIESYRAGGATPVGLQPGDFAKEVVDAEVIFGLTLPKNIVALAPRLKWVQVVGAGMDYLHDRGLLEAGVTITTSAGVNAVAVAECCVLAMLMHVKQLPKRLDAQRERRWTRYANDELRDKTLGIIGAGHIGLALAQRAKAFDMRVLAVKRGAAPGQALPHIDQLYPKARLREMLAQCDYVAAAVSLTPETRGMLGEPEFRAMKPGAYFINVARGAVVDEAALIAALKSGHLGGAALDVFVQEPLPRESPFWDLPNVFVSPHNAGGLKDHTRRSTESFCANLRRYLDGQPLLNVVTPDKGY